MNFGYMYQGRIQDFGLGGGGGALTGARRKIEIVEDTSLMIN